MRIFLRPPFSIAVPKFLPSQEFMEERSEYDSQLRPHVPAEGLRLDRCLSSETGKLVLVAIRSAVPGDQLFRIVQRSPPTTIEYWQIR